ncbi:SGNH/GDSL hydrolase family protein [Gordonia sp. (in: high G+C Gram-positive bacteria)]|uniref:SGNH/GDSL hydrolase family protein n=1 Tax=Gordonia sp. (in: high G+C Gram-positive bacteria) TaxID=84139 RepID=UPI003C76933F
MTDVISDSPSRLRARMQRGAVAVAIASVALLSTGLATASPASAAPAQTGQISATLIDAAGRLITQNIPALGTTGSSSIDLPGLFNILTPPGANPPGANPPNLAPTGDRRTSCQTVVHIGDSTSVGIDSALRIPSAADRLTAQYQRVGSKTVELNALGGRSIVEKVNDEPNAVDAIRTEKSAGKSGCWVIAMGVNDAANIAVGSAVNADQRIDRVMSELTGQPVLWPTVMTGNASNAAYSPDNMKSFNAALARATGRYPNLRIYDFASEAQPSWYVDGIHYNETGLVQRNRLFATALATAFPGR